MFSTSFSTEEIRKNGNKLKDSASLYLRQHAHNPVFWYPWGDEAHQKAIETDKPIFLSVGYSSCHWCHVMENEVFEKDDVAEYLNEHFICIKVDREERPDVDAVYIKAVQAMTGSGGWPMSVFMTPDLKPFFGGTYYPKDAFINLINRIMTLYRQDRNRLADQAERLHESIANSRFPVSDKNISLEQITSTMDYASKIFDETWGGFKSQMKFPTPSKWSFLLHLYRFNKDPNLGEMITTTLDAIQDGGIHDHLAGGFHRYTVDPTWSVPHFEKMLYDNAQLASLYFEASVVFKNDDYRNTAESILDFLNEEMSDKEGFYASFDADSEGEEGVYYVWSKSEIENIIGEDSGIICDYFGITNRGNFEGKNVLTISSDLETLAVKYKKTEQEIQDLLFSWIHKLNAIRKKRVPPTLDKKIVLSWNALTISAFVKGYRTTGKKAFLIKAQNTIEFIYDKLLSSNGNFYRTYSNGKHEGEAVLDDYAFLADALIDLFEVTGNHNYLDKTKNIIRLLKNDFIDPEEGFYFTHRLAKTPMGRQHEVFDNVEPSGFSIVLKVLHRLGWIYFDQNYMDIVNNNLKKYQEVMDRAKLDMASTFDVALMQHLKYYSLVMSINSIEDELYIDLLKFLPVNCMVIPLINGSALPDNIPGLDEKKQVDNQATAYLCDFGSCLEPITDYEKLGTYLI